MQLDSFDFKIMHALQQDGRLTNHILADIIGLSASQCSRRRVALEEAGYIAGYHARLDAEKLGLNVSAYVQVTLSRHSQDNAEKFLKLIARYEAIQEAYALTGQADYLLKVVAKDLKSFSEIINHALLSHEIITHVHSSIVLSTLKEARVLPL
jgi:DNA-binding Lrp family transcriptional regulator